MSEAMSRPIRVLAVDDSAVMRGVLRTLFLVHAEKPRPGLPQMELSDVVEDGVECLRAVAQLRPDVLLLDLEMPRMHGLDVLERLRLEAPDLPVIMCSSYTESGARTTLDALALGAADYVMKPREQSDFASAMETLASQLLPKIAALADEAASGQHGDARNVSLAEDASWSGGAVKIGSAVVQIVAIGVSTGGPSALEAMLPKLVESFPVPILIVQHMPKLFTGALAERLDRCCALRVREAHDGAELSAGTIWLAPGDAHMEVAEAATTGIKSARRERRAVVRLHQQRSLNHCKPSVDYLFSSAAALYGAGTLALVMTGMGSDGLVGARRVHQAGGAVLTQDAATSAVWGMPGRVFEAGISRRPLPLDALAAELTLRVQAGRNGRASAGGPSIDGSSREGSSETTAESQGKARLQPISVRWDEIARSTVGREGMHELL